MSATIISFATQKGGSGKTTLLMLTAAAIHCRTKKKVLVIDSDPQRSVKDIYRQENNPKSYDVFAFNWQQPNPEVNFEKVLKLAEDKYDVILMDVPGKGKGKEVFYSIMFSDVLIVPVVASKLDINATVSFLQDVPAIKERQGGSLEVFGVINKKDGSIEHKNLYELAGIGGLQLFYSPLSNLVRYKRHVSTVNDIADPKDPEDEFNRYFDEFCSRCYI
jgi:chromosome partitioning protein